MKIHHACTATALLLNTTSSAFTRTRPFQAANRPLPSNAPGTKNPLFDTAAQHTLPGPSALWAQPGKNAGDLDSYMGDDKSSEAGLAFMDIINDDMASLHKRLENGLNPNIKYFYGNTILHLIALKGTSQSLDDDKYRNILLQLIKSGANMDATNDAGSSVLDFLKMSNSQVFAENLKAAQSVKLKVPVKRADLDTQLATFSLQKQLTVNGKKRIPELIKMGANPEFVTFNGKTISENIKQNWPEASVAAFKKMVIVARFKRAANGPTKQLASPHLSDQWDNACLAFMNDKLKL